MRKMITLLLLSLQNIGYGSSSVEITEKSTKVYRQNFGSMEISFPEELKGRLEYYTDKSNALSMVSELIEFKFAKKRGAESKITTGWGDLGAIRSFCQEDEELKRSKKMILTEPSISLEIETIDNRKFHGKVLVTKILSPYWSGRISYQVINRNANECYDFSLSLNGFEPSNQEDIERAVSPIIDPIKNAIKKYTNSEDKQ